MPFNNFVATNVCQVPAHGETTRPCNKSSTQGCHDELGMLYEGRLQRYCLLLSKEKEVIQKMGFIKNTERRLRSRTFDEGDFKKDDKTKQFQKDDVKMLREEIPLRRHSLYCQPVMRRSKYAPSHSPSNSVIASSSQRSSAESGRRSSQNCETKFQQYKRHSLTLPSKIETPNKESKSKRRQEEMQKKAQHRVEALKSLETDCIKAKQLMNRFKSLSTTNLDMAGRKEENNNLNVKEDKRRVHSWHI